MLSGGSRHSVTANNSDFHLVEDILIKIQGMTGVGSCAKALC
jgi:hypothetical protein